ncbi:MAG: hypothetical protein E7100_10590 [Bacteroidaceae bacterium]|nr:hypothetical protein [Bacteroidaceae bacterium]
MKKISHKKTVERPCLECRLAFRLSAKEKQEIEAKAKLCAMSLSKYIRRCVVGHSPKLHLTEQETEAFISLANARGDIVHIKNAISGKSQEELLRYFRDSNFMNYWILATDKLIRRWYEIERQLSE